jgi:hypothetical protein
MVCWQLFMEVTDPVILDAKLLRGQAEVRLRPLGLSSLGCGRIVIVVSCRNNEPPPFLGLA